MRPIRIAVQMDDFARLEPASDSTISLMRTAFARDHAVYVYEPAQLRWVSDGAHHGVMATARRIVGWDKTALLPALGAPEPLDLATLQVVLMRQDPPFDMAYVTACYLLELLPPTVWVINNPKAVRDAPEKILIARYPDLLPPTIITADSAAVVAFRAQHGTLVLKPLYGFGADGITLWQAQDDDAVLHGFAQTQNGLPFIAQQFIPQVTQGDKRVLLLDGEVFGAINRVPQPGQFLANLHVGGRAEAATVTAADMALLAHFARDLAAMGIFLAGVDIIGRYVTEINVTCPSALIEINQVQGYNGRVRLEEKFWDAVELRLSTQANGS